MRRTLVLAGGILLALGPGAALADPRCASLGQPAYSAIRLISTNGTPAIASRVTLDGARQRIEAGGAGEGPVVTLITPELQAVFLATAEPRIALRLALPAPPPSAAGERRQREERGRAGTTFITELRGASGQWHVVERNLCRRDGVLLEAWQWWPEPGGGRVVETRQSEIRLIRPDPALFRLPAGFGLVDPPPRPRP